MASNYTENLNLCQWAAEDNVLREEFNADNAKIDAALAAIPGIRIGTYTGDGSLQRDIDLGAEAKLLMVWPLGNTLFSGTYGTSWGLVLKGHPAVLQSQTALELTETGFRVFYRINYGYNGNFETATNGPDTLYAYLAIV